MPSGAVYQLIANEGKADQMIMAPDLLLARIKQIRCAKEKAGLKETFPTLADIERTHVIFVNSHFKPFAPIAFEYYKGTPNQGTQTLGGTIWFNIPQFGEFFNDAVVHLTIAATAVPVGGVVPAAPAPIGPAKGPDSYAHWTTGRYVNNAGVELVPGAPCSDFVYYCDYPGARIFDKVDFQVSNVSIDNYPPDKYVFYQKCNLSKNKEIGYKRCMGQEVPIDGFSHVNSVSTVDGSTDTARLQVSICNGPQTPKATQPALDLWIPILFWFCEDVRNAIASVTMPSATRYIILNLCAYDRLLFKAAGNCWLETTAANFLMTGVGGPVLAYNATVTKVPVTATNSPALTAPAITTAEIYIGNIFVTPEIHEIYLNRIGFSLIRIHRWQSISVTTSNFNVQLNNLTFPTEQVYFGIRPQANELLPTRWHSFTYDVDNTIKQRVTSNTMLNWSDDPTTDPARMYCNSEVERFTYKTSLKTMTRCTIRVQGVPMYTEMPAEFFNRYVPFHFGYDLITTPQDEGVNLLNFAFYPRATQPSSHLNLSRTREFYIEFWSALVGSVVASANFVALGIHLNFLMLSDGSATLRYIT
jgi:hypothetical protein